MPGHWRRTGCTSYDTWLSTRHMRRAMRPLCQRKKRRGILERRGVIETPQHGLEGQRHALCIAAFFECRPSKSARTRPTVITGILWEASQPSLHSERPGNGDQFRKPKARRVLTCRASPDLSKCSSTGPISQCGLPPLSFPQLYHNSDVRQHRWH